MYLHPKEAGRPRTNRKRRLAVLREHGGRTGSANTGGVTRTKILTVYKEQALLVAKILRDNGPLLAQTVKKLGGPPNTAAILGRNPLHWFTRTREGGETRYTYHVNRQGLEALEQYEGLL